MHGVVDFLRHGLVNFGIYAIFAWIGARSRTFRSRERRRTALETVAGQWPAVEGVAACWVQRVGFKGFRLRMWAKPQDGAWRADWSREFALKEEADHYARALQGKTVAVHMEPYGSEKILCWDELKFVAPQFVSSTQGRLTHEGYVGAQAYRAVAWGGLGLAAADVAMFVRNPGFMWHGLCLCEFSLALLAVGCLLLFPASLLRFRMKNLPDVSHEWQFDGASRMILLFLVATAITVWVGVMSVHGLSDGSPDWMFYAVVSAPTFALFWWSSVIASASVRELRPIELEVGAAVYKLQAESEQSAGTADMPDTAALTAR